MLIKILKESELLFLVAYLRLFKNFKLNCAIQIMVLIFFNLIFEI